MRALDRRVRLLEGEGEFLTIGDLLDHLDGPPLPEVKRLPPIIVKALNVLPD